MKKYILFCVCISSYATSMIQEYEESLFSEVRDGIDLDIHLEQVVPEIIKASRKRRNSSTSIDSDYTTDYTDSESTTTPSQSKKRIAIKQAWWCRVCEKAFTVRWDNFLRHYNVAHPECTDRPPRLKPGRKKKGETERIKEPWLFQNNNE